MGGGFAWRDCPGQDELPHSVPVAVDDDFQIAE
jgi:hypothetical protein